MPPLLKHMGKRCTLKCETPCGHSDCRHCAVGQVIEKPQPQPDESRETVVVSRISLEGIAARAGLRTTWRGGEPWFTETVGAKGTTPREIEMEKRCRQLEAENAKLRKDIERVVARDDAAQDIVRKLAEEESRRQALNAEARAKQDMRDRGASEADIAALEALLGKKGPDLRDTVVPPKPRPRTPFAKPDMLSLYTVDMIEEAVRKMGVAECSQDVLHSSHRG